MHKLCSALARLTDSELVSEVKRLAANERHATSELVASIAALDARRIYLAEGYPSTHAYLVEALGFSNDAAFYRITAARAVQKFPGILEKLRTGALTLKAIRLLAPHLDEANHEEILDAAAHKSADEILHLLAARNPRPDVVASIRKLPERRGAPSPMKAAMERGPDRDTAAPRRQQSLSAATNTETAGGEAGRPRARAVDRSEPRASRKPRSRHIPAAVRREVWRRDEGRCAYVSPGGKRCGATAGLEFHHVVPFAAGGEATVENVIVACRKHNDHEAERFFGIDYAPHSRTTTGITGEHSTCPGTCQKLPTVEKSGG